MAFPEVGSQSFEFYEGIRIVIPGVISAGLVSALQGTLSPGSGNPLSVSGTTAILVVLVFGFIAYLLDLPTKSVIYRQFFPSDELKMRYPEVTDAAQAWLMLLDTTVPANIRARALYMGSIFRIGFEIVLLLVASQFVLWSWVAHQHGSGLKSSPDYYWPLFAALLSTFAWPLGIEVHRAYRTQPSRKGVHQAVRRWARAAARGVARVGRQLETDMGRATRWVSALASLLAWTSITRIRNPVWMPGPNEPLSRLTVLVASTVLALVWLLLFFFGRADGTRRVAVHRMTLLTQYLLTIMPLLVECRFRGDHADLTSGQASLWMVAAIATGILMFAGGHERKWRGAYTSQVTWMKRHDEEIKKALRLT